MQDKEGLYVSGPVFISRLEAKNSIIYNIGDIHHSLEEQTECPMKWDTLYIHQHLYKLFKSRKNKSFNFYLETHCSYGQYFSSNPYNTIYINQVRKVFHDFMKDKNKKNVGLFAFDERLGKINPFSHFAMSSLQLSFPLDRLLFYICCAILIYGIARYILIKMKKDKKSEPIGKVMGIFLVFSISYIIYYSISIMLNRSYKKQFLESHKDNKYTKVIINSNHKHVRNEYDILINYIRNNNNSWENFLCCTYIIDLWCIDNMLDKKINNDSATNIIYSGLSHSDHIMFFLIKNYDYKITHTSDNNDNLIKKIMSLGSLYDVEKLIRNSFKSYDDNKIRSKQCCDISQFPTEEFHIKS